MTPAARKIAITLVTFLAAAGIFVVVAMSKPKSSTTPASTPSPAVSPAASPTGSPDSPQTPAQTPAAEGSTPDAAAPAAAPGSPAPGVALSTRTPEGMTATKAPTALGSLDPEQSRYRIEFSSTGAGIESIVFSDYWKTARDLTAARAHKADPSKPMPPDSERYVLASATPLHWGANVTMVPVFAAHSLVVNGTTVDLFSAPWAEAAPGRFVVEIVDAQNVPQFRVERAFELSANTYDLTLRQGVTNLTGTAAKIRWIQYGPSELAIEAGASIEVRRFHFGYLNNKERDPTQEYVLTTGQMFEHATAMALAPSASNPSIDNTLWPNKDAKAAGLSLSWAATSSRYFALGLHPRSDIATQPGSKSISDVIEKVTVQSNFAPVALDTVLLTAVHSPEREIAPSATSAFDLGVYAGPLDPKTLGQTEPYLSLGMRQSIVYQLSSCCSFCTFPWLANFMASFLSTLHNYVVFDWGLAIIVLVLVVRTLLHPLMKSSQIKMQRFGRAMGELKPELDAIQKRYKDDPKTAQMEQMRLYREKGVNPIGCVSGILPNFLQMPIWIALYAVLYFNIDLRQQAAFFGVFQNFNGWQFLGDLSRPDNFFEFTKPIPLVLFELRGINLLPLIMGVVFFLQQKYMTPPTPNMTPEQEQQQKMMKVMMVVMFPVMLYAAPSGLTLYILTSTCIGIFESRMVKKHIDRYGLAAPPKVARKPGGALAARLAEMQRQKEEQKQKRTFKDRD